MVITEGHVSINILSVSQFAGLIKSLEMAFCENMEGVGILFSWHHVQ